MNTRLGFITLSKGDRAELEKTIMSISRQLFACDAKPWVGLVLADGVDEKTREIMSSYNRSVDIEIVSTSDTGISDGFNKGLRYLAESRHGFTHFMFLNSGDLFRAEDSYRKLVREIERRGSERFTCFYGTIMNGSTPQKSYPFSLRWVSGINHIGFVQSIDTVLLNSFKTHLKTAMDYDYILNLKRKGVRLIEYEGCYVYADPNGISSRINLSVLAELRSIQRAHFYDPLGLYQLLYLYRVCRYGMKVLRRRLPESIYRLVGKRCFQ